MKVFALFLFILGFTLSGFSQEKYVERIPELQKQARLATGGALGCGKGSYVLVTSKGEINAGGGLDPIHVFGKRIVIADLLPILSARIEHNETGKKNAMSGDVNSLLSVMFTPLRQSKDPVLAESAYKLLNDRSDSVKVWSLMILIDIANADENEREKIEKREFPSKALKIAKTWGVKIPAWIKAEKSK